MLATGWRLFEQRRPGAAEKEFRAALALRPDWPTPWPESDLRVCSPATTKARARSFSRSSACPKVSRRTCAIWRQGRVHAQGSAGLHSLVPCPRLSLISTRRSTTMPGRAGTGLCRGRRAGRHRGTPHRGYRAHQAEPRGRGCVRCSRSRPKSEVGNRPCADESGAGAFPCRRIPKAAEAALEKALAANPAWARFCSGAFPSGPPISARRRRAVGKKPLATCRPTAMRGKRRPRSSSKTTSTAAARTRRPQQP
jgi:hypothetical protein